MLYYIPPMATDWRSIIKGGTAVNSVKAYRNAARRTSYLFVSWMATIRIALHTAKLTSAILLVAIALSNTIYGMLICYLKGEAVSAITIGNNWRIGGDGDV